MPKIAKRALWGYAATDVDELIDDMQAAHEERCRQMQQQIDALQQANEKLRTDTARLAEGAQATDRADEEIAARLFSAHLEQTTRVSAMMQEIEELAARNNEVLEVSQRHRETVVNQVMDKMRNMESLIVQSGREGDHGSFPLETPPLRSESEEGERVSAPAQTPAGQRVGRAGGEV